MVKVPISKEEDDEDREDEDGEGEEAYDYVNEANWVRVNDKAPIWMRSV